MRAKENLSSAHTKKAFCSSLTEAKKKSERNISYPPPPCAPFRSILLCSVLFCCVIGIFTASPKSNFLLAFEINFCAARSRPHPSFSGSPFCSPFVVSFKMSASNGTLNNNGVIVRNLNCNAFDGDTKRKDASGKEFKAKSTSERRRRRSCRDVCEYSTRWSFVL